MTNFPRTKRMYTLMGNKPSPDVIWRGKPVRIVTEFDTRSGAFVLVETRYWMILAPRAEVFPEVKR